MIILLFTRDDVETVIHSDDAFAPVGYINLKKLHFEEKNVSSPFFLKFITSKRVVNGLIRSSKKIIENALK